MIPQQTIQVKNHLQQQVLQRLLSSKLTNKRVSINLKKYFLTLAKGKKFQFSILILCIISTSIAIYSWLQPNKITSENVDNDLQIKTQYDYQATISPNILYPDGGVIEKKKELVKAILSDIPFTINSTIRSDKPVTVKGSYEIQLIVKADNIWEKKFTIGEKKNFSGNGTEISIFKGDRFKIDYESVSDFISDVEEELSIQPEYYSLIVQPYVNGIIQYNDSTQVLTLQDQLVFQDYFENVILGSDTEYSSSLPFTTSTVTENEISLFKFTIPLILVRLISSVLALLFLAIYLLLIVKFKQKQSVQEKIIRKHKDKLIPLSKQIETYNHSVVHLHSFKSLLQISDSKELPIFYVSSSIDHATVYFIIDSYYIFQYKFIEKPMLNHLEERDAYALD